MVLKGRSKRTLAVRSRSPLWNTALMGFFHEIQMNKEKFLKLKDENKK